MSTVQRRYKYLDALTTAFVVILLVSNLVAQKICFIGPFGTGRWSSAPSPSAALCCCFPSPISSAMSSLRFTDLPPRAEPFGLASLAQLCSISWEPSSSRCLPPQDGRTSRLSRPSSALSHEFSLPALSPSGPGNSPIHTPWHALNFSPTAVNFGPVPSGQPWLARL